MGLLTESFITIVELTKVLDGDTPEAKAAADTAIGETVSAMLDMVPFPIQASVLGIISLDISRAQMDTALDRVRAAIRTYVNVTTV